MHRDGLTFEWRYFAGAIGIHAAMALLLVGMNLTRHNVVQPQLSLTAVMVDRATLNQLMKQSQPAERAPATEPVVEPQPDPAVKQREQEQAERERQEKLKQEQLKQAQLKQEQLQQEQLKQEQLLKQQEQARQKAEAEKQEAQRKAEAKRAQQEAEQKRVAEIQQKQREAEAKRAADAEAKAQKARESELAAQLAAEEGRANAVNAGLLNQYVALIQQKVMRQWIKPPTARAGLECEVKVTQATGGTVLSVSVGRCNGDQAVRASIETAVNAASPLPSPPDLRLFERNLTFIFKPTE